MMKVSEVYQGGRGFLAVGVGETVFACNSMVFVSCVCSLLVPYTKLLQVKNAVNILVTCVAGCFSITMDK